MACAVLPLAQLAVCSNMDVRGYFKTALDTGLTGVCGNYFCTEWKRKEGADLCWLCTHAGLSCNTLY